jgi:hypothetical protein
MKWLPPRCAAMMVVAGSAAARPGIVCKDTKNIVYGHPFARLAKEFSVWDESTGVPFLLVNVKRKQSIPLFFAGWTVLEYYCPV